MEINLSFVNIKNSISVIDASGKDPFFNSQYPIDLFGFLEQQNVSVVTTSSSAQRELPYQSPSTASLFGGVPFVDWSVTPGNQSTRQYVFSSTNGSLTTPALDPGGYPVKIIHSLPVILEPVKQSECWNKLSDVDKSIVECAQGLMRNSKETSVLTNDSDLIKCLQSKGVLSIRPSKLLALMVKKKFISYQKGTSVYAKWGEIDKSWVKKNTPFKEILDSVCLNR